MIKWIFEEKVIFRMQVTFKITKKYNPYSIMIKMSLNKKLLRNI